MRWAVMNISTTVMFAARDVSLTNAMKELNNAGKAERNACGRIMRRIIVTYGMFAAKPASSCPLGTARIAPRNVSAA